MRVDGRLYTGWLKRATRRLGLHTHLKSVYWGLGVPRLLHRLSRRERITHDVAGVAVTVPVEREWQYARFRWMHPELPLFERLVEELRDGDVFYDVGAHLGWHTVVAASAADVSVVAFEPHPTVADRLETVAAATGHDVDVRRVALSEESGTAPFTAAPSPAASLGGSSDADGAAETITVEVADGDGLVEAGTLAPPDVLKIDAEGADAAVLGGLSETIERHPPRVIYCEVHRDGAEIRALLSELGYETERLPAARPVLRAVPDGG